MLRSFKRFWVLVLLATSIIGAGAFSLLGPIDTTYQVPAIGYDLAGNPGGPMNLGEEYRWTIPVVTYGFDQSFLDYFGSNGVRAVEQAIAILNGTNIFQNVTNLTPLTGPYSAMSPGLVEFPQNVQRVHLQARALGLRDLKSVTLSALLEQLGLADPERFTWTLRARLADTANTNYVVIQRNFDPISFEPSSFVNGTLYTYRIFDPIPGTDSAGAAVNFSDAREFPADPDAFANTAVANNALLDGGYYTGLSRDDVGGLRYLYRKENRNVENLQNDIQLAVTNSTPTLLTNFDLTLFASRTASGTTNTPAQLLAFYPGLIITSNTLRLTNLVTTNIITYFTNFPVGQPQSAYVTNFTTNQVTVFDYAFGNVRTNSRYSSGLVTDQFVNVTLNPNYVPGLGQFVTNFTSTSYPSNYLNGDFYIIPNTLLDFSIGSTQMLQVVTFTNVVSSVFGNLFAFTNTASMLPLQTDDLTLLTQRAAGTTLNANQLRALYPNILITTTNARVTNVLITNYVGSYVFVTNALANVFDYTFGNVVTTRVSSVTPLVLQTVEVVPNPSVTPGGALFITNVIGTSLYSSNLVSGEFYIVPTNLLGFQFVVSNLFTDIFKITNLLVTNLTAVFTNTASPLDVISTDLATFISRTERTTNTPAQVQAFYPGLLITSADSYLTNLDVTNITTVFTNYPASPTNAFTTNVTRLIVTNFQYVFGNIQTNYNFTNNVATNRIVDTSLAPGFSPGGGSLLTNITLIPPFTSNYLNGDIIIRPTNLFGYKIFSTQTFLVTKSTNVITSVFGNLFAFTNTSSLQPLQTEDLTLLTQRSYGTSLNANQLRALYPNLLINSTNSRVTNIMVTNYVGAYVFVTNALANVFDYTYGNVVTTRVASVTPLTLQTVEVVPNPNITPGSAPFITNLLSSVPFSSNLVSGEFYIVPTNLLGFQFVFSPLFTDIIKTTNLLVTNLTAVFTNTANPVDVISTDLATFITRTERTTNTAAQLLALYPGLVITSTHSYLTNLEVTNIATYFTNYPSAPTNVFTTNITTLIVTNFQYTFGNIQTNYNFTNNNVINRKVDVSLSAGFSPGVGSLITNITVIPPLTSNYLNGDIIIRPTNLFAFNIFSTQSFLVTKTTNVITSAFGNLFAFTNRSQAVPVLTEDLAILTERSYGTLLDGNAIRALYPNILITSTNSRLTNIVLTNYVGTNVFFTNSLGRVFDYTYGNVVTNVRVIPTVVTNQVVEIMPAESNVGPGGPLRVTNLISTSIITSNFLSGEFYIVPTNLLGYANALEPGNPIINSNSSPYALFTNLLSVTNIIFTNTTAVFTNRSQTVPVVTDDLATLTERSYGTLLDGNAIRALYPNILITRTNSRLTNITFTNYVGTNAFASNALARVFDYSYGNVVTNSSTNKTDVIVQIVEIVPAGPIAGPNGSLRITNVLNSTTNSSNFLSGDFYIVPTNLFGYADLVEIFPITNRVTNIVFTNATAVYTNRSAVTNLVTTNLHIFTQRARTNTTAAFLALYPGVLISQTNSTFTTQVTPVVTTYLTNFPWSPFGVFTVVSNVTFLTNVTTVFDYTFANVITNNFLGNSVSNAPYIGGFVTRQGFTVAQNPFAPFGSPGVTNYFTSTTLETTNSDGTPFIDGTVYIVPPNLFGFDIVGTQLVTLDRSTNVIFVSTTTNNSVVVTNARTELVTYSTNYFFTAYPIEFLNPTNVGLTGFGVRKELVRIANTHVFSAHEIEFLNPTNVGLSGFGRRQEIVRTATNHMFSAYEIQLLPIPGNVGGGVGTSQEVVLFATNWFYQAYPVEFLNPTNVGTGLGRRQELVRSATNTVSAVFPIEILPIPGSVGGGVGRRQEVELYTTNWFYRVYPIEFLNPNNVGTGPGRRQELVRSVTNTVSGVYPIELLTAPGSLGAGLVSRHEIITYGTNAILSVFPIVFQSGNNLPPGLRQGVDKITFQRVNFDSLLGQTFVQITNTFPTQLVVSNSGVVTQYLRRVVTQPDILFLAGDLGVNANGSPQGIGRSTSISWINNNLLNGQNTLAGPGVITPQKRITFNKVGVTYRNFAGTPFLDETTANKSFIWGSFDGSTNAPIIYPSGTSIQDLERQVLTSP